MLSEYLVAARIISAGELLVIFMCLEVTSQACGSGEGFITTLVIADMVFLFGMGALDMMTEVGLTKESLVAGSVGASKGSFSSMRSDVLFKTSRTIEDLLTSLERA